jgi:hypothetical protein
VDLTGLRRVLLFVLATFPQAVFDHLLSPHVMAILDVEEELAEGEQEAVDIALRSVWEVGAASVVATRLERDESSWRPEWARPIVRLLRALTITDNVASHLGPRLARGSVAARLIAEAKETQTVTDLLRFSSALVSREAEWCADLRRRVAPLIRAVAQPERYDLRPLRARRREDDDDRDELDAVFFCVRLADDTTAPVVSALLELAAHPTGPPVAELPSFDDWLATVFTSSRRMSTVVLGALLDSDLIERQPALLRYLPPCREVDPEQHLNSQQTAKLRTLLSANKTLMEPDWRSSEFWFPAVRATQIGVLLPQS